MRTEIWIVLWFLIWGISWYLLSKIYFLVKTKNNRQNAVQKSRSVLLGNIHEQIIPLLPEFPYQYKDLIFLGKWVDYIIFNGLSKWDLKEIVFLEIKTGSSQLNKNESMIKSCIEDKKVVYKTRRKK